MKTLLRRSTRIVIFTIAISCAIISNRAGAVQSIPNWFLGEVQHGEDAAVAVVEKECSNQTVIIDGIAPRLYDNNRYSTEQEVCVYDSGGYRYAWYMRSYYYIPTAPQLGTLGEGGIAVSLGNSNFKPVQGFGDRDSDTQLYLGITTSFLEHNSSDQRLSIYEDVGTHIVQQADGAWMLDGQPDYQYTDAYGGALKVYGVGLSHNKKWASFGVRNFGIITLNLKTKQVNRISDRYDVLSSRWPTPGLTTSISDDGKYVVVGGTANQTEVIATTGCGSAKLAESLNVFHSELLLTQACPYIDVTDTTWNNSDPVGLAGYRAFDKAQMSASGGSFSYYDSYKWHTIYAPNYLAPGQLYYLALGDSYASGEGDITLDGADHYVAGTNEYGNYNIGIPRETCHISKRAYSMRIAEAMQLTRGIDMQSVACAGAVTNDVLTASMKSTGYIDAGYLGQATQRIASSGARLAGLSNTQKLQDDARTSYLPGRVQQIELVKKSQPKYLTVMMGGNDLDFAGVLTTCAKNSLPSSEDTCEYAYGDGLAGEAQKVHDLYPKLVGFYKALKEVSPHTTTYVIGYPQFMDTNSESCPEMLGLFTQIERQAIHGLISYANGVIRNAALDAGVKYIDVSNALVGKRLCGSGAGMTGVTDVFATMIYTEYMKSLAMADSNIAKHVKDLLMGSLHKAAMELYVTERAATFVKNYLYSPATTIADVTQELSHPNAIGHEAIYNSIREGLGEDLLESTACNQVVSCPSGTTLGQPNVADYIDGVTLKGNTVHVSGKGKVIVGHNVIDSIMMTGALVKSLTSQFIRIGIGILDGAVDPTQPVTVEIHSQPIVLGVMSRVGDEYELRTSLTQDIAVGQHVLYIKGQLTDGRAFVVDVPVFVEGPGGDMDDDGVLDVADTCAFKRPSGVDKDKDGIDDECDLNINQEVALPSAVDSELTSENQRQVGILSSAEQLSGAELSKKLSLEGVIGQVSNDGGDLLGDTIITNAERANAPNQIFIWFIAGGVLGIACLFEIVRRRK